MRIASGVTDQVIYFVALDATDLKTRETGLDTFTVYRSRNGGTATAFTTPTVTELDDTNMPGVYSLLLDEDMTIDSGDETQEMVFHITHSGMAPVTRVIELYRPKITVGNTLSVESDGDLTKVNTLDGHTAQTGDAYAIVNSGTHGNAALKTLIDAVDNFVDTEVASIISTLSTIDGKIDTIDTNVDAVLVDTGTTLPGTLSTIAGYIDTEIAAIISALSTINGKIDTIDVQSEVQDAIEANHLDHLIAVADPGSIVADNSLLAKLVSKSATPSFSSFNNTTDSLEAIRDRGDAAWTGGGGGSGPTAEEIADEIETRELTVGTNNDKTGYSLDSVTIAAIATAVEESILDEEDGQAILNAIVGAIGNQNVNEIALVAAIRADLERSGGNLNTLVGRPSPLDAAGTRTAVGLSSANLDTQLSTISTNVTAIKDLSEASEAIDTGTTPWKRKKLKKGTGDLGAGTVLLTQDLKDIDGGNLSSTETVVGRAIG